MVNLREIGGGGHPEDGGVFVTGVVSYGFNVRVIMQSRLKFSLYFLSFLSLLSVPKALSQNLMIFKRSVNPVFMGEGHQLTLRKNIEAIRLA
jgi:hypothetical protein